MSKRTPDDLRTPGGLTDTFIHCDTCLPDEAYNRLRYQEYSEKETSILLGQPGGSVDGVIERGSTASGGRAKRAEARKAQERRNARFVELAREAIERLKADIEAMEDVFRARDGDAWREKLALEILGEDDIPQRRPGESMEDYRERLEKHLIDEMLNPDGTIKDKYKNDPRYRDYAEWAQKQYNLNKARSAVAELEDPSTTPARRTDIFNDMRERGSMEEIMIADLIAEGADTKLAVRDTRDALRDSTAQNDQTSEANAFLTLDS